MMSAIFQQDNATDKRAQLCMRDHMYMVMHASFVAEANGRNLAMDTRAFTKCTGPRPTATANGS